MPKLDLRQDENKSESGNETDGSGTARLVDDPMANDAFDSNEVMDRRTELIETDSFGPVHARCLGDPDNPLLLYIHGSKVRATSEQPHTLGGVRGCRWVADAARSDGGLDDGSLFGEVRGLLVKRSSEKRWWIRLWPCLVWTMAYLGTARWRDGGGH